MGWNIHMDDCPVQRLAGDGTLREGDTGCTCNSLHRADHIHQSRQIVRSHIEHRTTTWLVVKLGCRVPHFMSATEHKGGCRNRSTDDAVINQFPAGLVSSS